MQTFQNFDNSLLSISGEGYVIQDSININYSSGGSSGVFECTCKGIKKQETRLNRNVDDNLKIKVFPNPVREVLYLDVKNECRDFSILIFKAQGGLIMNKKIFQKNMINVSELTCGIYYYVLTDRTNLYSGYFIKE